jgi:5-methylcytosine-specific restriction endonuclease McrA
MIEQDPLYGTTVWWRLCEWMEQHVRRRVAVDKVPKDLRHLLLNDTRARMARKSLSCHGVLPVEVHQDTWGLKPDWRTLLTKPVTVFLTKSDNPEMAHCCDCLQLLPSSSMSRIEIYGGHRYKLLCGPCFLRKWGTPCMRCGEKFLDGWSYCKPCRQALLEEAEAEHTRPCGQCSAIFFPGPTWPAGAYYSSIPRSRASLLCTPCHARDLHAIRKRLGEQRRRAERFGRAATLTEEEWLVTLEHFEYQCAYCQREAAQAIDHFHPLHLGGGTTADNCAPVCWTCNTSKHKKTPEEWVQECPRVAKPERVERVRAYLASRRG